MGMTPFDGGLLPFDADLREYAGKKVFKPFDIWCSMARIPSRLISGPQGTGKTALVRSYFTHERCQELADKQKLLIQLCYFSSNQFKNDEDVFLTLIEAVTKSLNNLTSDSEAFRKLSLAFQEIQEQERYNHIRTDWREGCQLLEALTEQLEQEGYHVTLIIDDFQHLTCSENCAASTFSMMANLAQNELLSYIVVTDLSIRTGSENYTLSSFERIFGADALIPSKVNKRDPIQRLRRHIHEELADMQEDEDDPIVFTENELDELWALTDGIPGLLQEGLKALYHAKEETRVPLNGEQMKALLLYGCKGLMRRWTRHFDKNYWQTLREVLKGDSDESIGARLPVQQDRRIELRSCGLIDLNMRQQTWTFICPLFEDYLRTELSRPQTQNTHEELGNLLKGVQESGGSNMTVNLTVQTGTVIHTGGGDILAPGATKTSFQVLTADDFLTRLGLSGQSFQMGGGLPGWTYEGAVQIGERLRSALLPEEQFSEQTRDQALDLLLAKNANEILPDIDPESLKNTSLEKLNQQFCTIRNKMGLDADLNDELINSLSPLCRFYVQAALIVEDHMENIMGLLNDYSTHLVMYGKCLEQSLRDTLFPLLRAHPHFRDYNTYTHADTPGDLRTFGAMPSETRAMLGNFCHILSQKGPQLAGLCADYQIQAPDSGDASWGAAEWTNWWQNFSHRLYTIKNIRNRVHAGSGAPTQQDLEHLRQGTFGSSGVLHMCQIGQALFSKISESEAGFN